MINHEQLEEIRRAIRQRRHLSWETIEKLFAMARKTVPTPDDEARRLALTQHVMGQLQNKIEQAVRGVNTLKEAKASWRDWQPPSADDKSVACVPLREDDVDSFAGVSIFRVTGTKLSG